MINKHLFKTNIFKVVKLKFLSKLYNFRITCGILLYISTIILTKFLNILLSSLGTNRTKIVSNNQIRVAFSKPKYCEVPSKYLTRYTNK